MAPDAVAEVVESDNSALLVWSMQSADTDEDLHVAVVVDVDDER